MNTEQIDSITDYQQVKLFQNMKKWLRNFLSYLKPLQETILAIAQFINNKI